MSGPKRRRTREERAVLEVLKPIALRIQRRVGQRVPGSPSSNGRRRRPAR